MWEPGKPQAGLDPVELPEKEREWLNLLHAGQTTLEEAWLCLDVPSCERKGCVLNGIAKIAGVVTRSQGTRLLLVRGPLVTTSALCNETDHILLSFLGLM